MSQFSDPFPASPPPRKTSNNSTPIIIAVVVVLLLCCGGLMVIPFLGVATLMPAVSKARDAARSLATKNSLKQVGLGMIVYQESHKHLPPAYTQDSSGQTLHSWRTELLPYLERQDLYEAIDRESPWNSPSNQRFASEVVQAYLDPQQPDPTQTSIVVVTGPGTCFEPGKQISFRDINDGITNTAVAFAVPGVSISWFEPKDMTLDELQSHLSTQPPGELVHVLFADASVRSARVEDLLPVLRPLVLRSDGEMFTFPGD